MTPTALTDWDIAALLTRHPLEADYIAKTKLAIASGTYDWAQTLPDWFFGLIPPWGTQFEDSTWGTVTVFFDTKGVLRVTGYSPVAGDINKPGYVPPPHKCKDGSDPSIVGTCPEDFNILYWVLGLGLVAVVVVLAVEFEVFNRATKG